MHKKRSHDDIADVLSNSQSSECRISDVSSPRAKRSQCSDREGSIVDNNENWSSWTVDEVAIFLEKKELTDEASLFRKQNISGSLLPMLNDDRLEKMGISIMGQRLMVLQELQGLQKIPHGYSAQNKIFNDPIHGHIELHPLCIKIIDTPQFQRLRFIKQLGGTYFVYPGASHNRFEHCLGVSHLAGKLCRTIQHRQPELNITDEDVLCVEVAGLCHDLGHGPFSHLFDKFISFVRPEIKWKHEERSVALFDYLLEDNELKETFEDYNLFEKDLTFIKEQIRGPVQNGTNTGAWPFKGRTPQKGFLYEIVANKRNEIDVDKWDYFARDCHMLGIRNNFDHERFMKFARVLSVDGELQICSRDKEVENLYDMFHTRKALHTRAYQHKVGSIIEIMIMEALVKADDHIKIPGKNGKLFKMSTVVDDIEAFSKLTDFVIYQILLDPRPELEKSKEILLNVMRRRLYKFIGQTAPTVDKPFTKDDYEQIKHDMVLQSNGHPKLRSEDIVVNLVFLDYGMKDKNPIDHVRFYSKEDPTVPIRVRKDEVSQMLPEKFAEQKLNVYCKLRDTKSCEEARKCFKEWCKQNNFPSPKKSMLTPDNSGQRTGEVTPSKESSTISAGKSQTKLKF